MRATGIVFNKEKKQLKASMQEVRKILDKETNTR